MRAGYFPQDWAFKIIRYGFREGIQIGWLVILYSFPYNAMGIIISFFLMKTTAQFACGNADAQE
jgi:hypothetical protein